MIELPIPKNIPFMKYKVWLILLSLVVTIGSLVIMFKNGLNYGIDFKGGVKLLYAFNAPVQDGEIKSILLKNGVDSVVQRYGNTNRNQFTIKTKQTEETLEGSVAKITDILTLKYGAENMVLEQQETVGPKVGQELKRKGQLAIFFTLIAMLVYIGIKFNFYFAPGAIVALIHDVVVVMGFLTFFNKEFNLSILAALLTIVGYSINDTIIVYDRIREHAKKINVNTIDEVVNQSINETLSRTIITSFTVLIVVAILFFSGGGVIHDFAFCFIIGVVTGSYSSIFIASPIYIWLYKHWPRIAAKFKKW
ncbi:MAG: protein translocase subunit SecF [Deltaproteobacteria bacterium CG11_big_fil_rev_8_21_14_0_20_49_13]|nr:MAG: protein translocase subunit SecF [Deltaproteobacteria bacterium CG11_big_fil_rev_8_21_14_0_20_49_13]